MKKDPPNTRNAISTRAICRCHHTRSRWKQLLPYRGFHTPRIQSGGFFKEFSFRRMKTVPHLAGKPRGLGMWGLGVCEGLAIGSCVERIVVSVSVSTASPRGCWCRRYKTAPVAALMGASRGGGGMDMEEEGLVGSNNGAEFAAVRRACSRVVCAKKSPAATPTPCPPSRKTSSAGALFAVAASARLAEDEPAGARGAEGGTRARIETRETVRIVSNYGIPAGLSAI